MLNVILSICLIVVQNRPDYKMQMLPALMFISQRVRTRPDLGVYVHFPWSFTNFKARKRLALSF